MLPWKWRILYWLTFLPLSILLFGLLFIKGMVRTLLVLPFRGLRRAIFTAPANEEPIRLLCLAYLNDENASARHRLYKYVRHISEKEIDFDIFPPTNSSTYQRFFVPWKRWGQYRYFIIVFLQRFRAIWRSPKYDAVFLQREILSEFFYDPPLFIFALRLLNSRIIYDVDDAVWTLPPQSIRAKSRILNFLARLRFYWNVRLSKGIIVSTEYISDHVRKINKDVKVIPTLVDVEDFPIREHKASEPVIIGWTGGPGNLIFLKTVEKPLARLALKYPIKLRVISSRTIDMDGIDVDFVRWDKATEVTYISSFDIGIMPMPENDYTKGKGGFKILEYMAAGLPAVIAPVGVNAHIIKNKTNGFFAKDDQEWIDTLSSLIKDVSLRKKMGAEARAFVSKHYDYEIWVDIFVATIREVAGDAHAI